MNNKHYFEFSQKHTDDIIDFSKPKGILVINRNNNESETELMRQNHELIKLITTYETLEKDNDIKLEYLNIIIDKIINIIETTNLINYSPFCVYFQVVGYSFNAYKSEKNNMSLDDKRKLFRQLLNLYIDNRHDIYIFHGYSDNILQVNCDAASSRRKGKTGIEKVEEILNDLHFIKAETISNLYYAEYCYLLPDKGDIDLFNEFLKDNNIVFEFRKTRDNKNPDMLLKIKDNYYILEHKLTNGAGGSQNAELNEIIQFIKYSEKNHKWHYIACLQGDYFKKLNEHNDEPKIQAQYENILTNLEKNPSNYFVNGEGLKKLVTDLSTKNEVVNQMPSI